MKLARLISISCDYSEAALEEAWEMAGKPSTFYVIVGTEQCSYARTVRLNGKAPQLFVNPEWTTAWMLSSPMFSVFSEGV